MPPVASSTDDLPEQQRQQQAQHYMPGSSSLIASSGKISDTQRGSVTSASTAIAAQPADPSIPPTTRSPSRQAPPMKPAKLPPGTPSVRSNSMKESLRSSDTPTKASKPKGASFFGFLTVKEPSARALLDYEEHVRKQAQTRNGRLTAVGMPGVSSAKLPVTVPKVNSKWDGIPQAVKEKEKGKEKEANQRQSTTSGRSFRTNLSAITRGGSDRAHSSSSTLDSESSRRNAGTGSSIFSSKSASQSSFGTKSGCENGSISSGSDIKDLPCRTKSQSLRSHSSTTLAELPSLTSDGSANRMKRRGDEKGTSTDPEQFPPIPRLTESESDSFRLVELTAAVASRHVPLTTTPTTPSRGCITPTTHQDNTSNTTSTSSNLAQADVSVKSSGADVLGPPAAVRTKAKLQPPLTGEAGSMGGAQVEPSHSILRRDASRPESNGPVRPPMSSYYMHSAMETREAWQRPGSETSTEGDMVAPGGPEGVATRSDAGRASPSVAPNGRGLLKRGRWAIFNK